MVQTQSQSGNHLQKADEEKGRSFLHYVQLPPKACRAKWIQQVTVHSFFTSHAPHARPRVQREKERDTRDLTTFQVVT